MASRDLLPDLLKTLELWGETAFGSSVNDEDDFAFIAFEGLSIALLYINISINRLTRMANREKRSGGEWKLR